MDPLLIDRWMEGLTPIPLFDEASVALARQAARTLGAEVGLASHDVGRLAILVSELAMNALLHGRRGLIGLRSIEREGTAGVEVVAADHGPGIGDPTGALASAPRAHGSLGAGLSGAMRLADEVDFDVRLGQGTCVCARKFAGPTSRRREVAIFGRPAEDERISGDDATFARRGGLLVLGLADGLGHGEPALEASSRAIALLHEHAERSPGEILRGCDAALATTRGAVMAALQLDESAGDLAHACVGNIATQLIDRRSTRTLDGPAFVLGGRGASRPRVRENHAVVARHEVVVMFSDGLLSRTRIEDEPDLLRQHPIVIAHRLLRDFARTNDDATVLVAR